LKKEGVFLHNLCMSQFSSLTSPLASFKPVCQYRRSTTGRE